MLEALIVLFPALFVSIVAACRMWHLDIFTHKLLWVAVYVLIGGFAFFELAEAVEALLFNGEAPHLPSALVLIGLCLWLWDSWHTWDAGPPAYFVKPTS